LKKLLSIIIVLGMVSVTSVLANGVEIISEFKVTNSYLYRGLSFATPDEEVFLPAVVFIVGDDLEIVTYGALGIGDDPYNEWGFEAKKSFFGHLEILASGFIWRLDDASSWDKGFITGAKGFFEAGGIELAGGFLWGTDQDIPEFKGFYYYASASKPSVILGIDIAVEVGYNAGFYSEGKGALALFDFSRAFKVWNTNLIFGLTIPLVNKEVNPLEPGPALNIKLAW